MTSSLVGSEMCIRDRHRGLLCVWASGLRMGTHPGKSLQQESLPWMPVSYTHLTLPTICSV
eukprot:186559-Prorocentrum_lima.AAC.1